MSLPISSGMTFVALLTAEDTSCGERIRVEMATHAAISGISASVAK